jgi:plasmid stability protein
MKSITIHNLDESLDTLLRKKARQKGTSLNKTIKSLLEDSLGITPESRQGHRDDFLDLYGIWSPNEVAQFEKTQSDFAKIDPEDWA